MTSRERALEQVRAAVLVALTGHDARVYLFGSEAQGAARRGSDIDVAVDPTHPLPPGVLARLRETLEESTIPYEVDLVDLKEADPAFVDRVRREGVLWKG